ncbi:hypothetical protein IWX49DRAFT_594911 [Phyllosticta citricarpa]|uniref:Uncharacterized protein n=1 Tax=Phyllosticta citricarpa TaxID=55181 RepID=A0ABR1LS16_9PEZI
MDTYHSQFFAVSANIREGIDIRTTSGSRFVAKGDVRTTNIATIGGADVPNKMDTYHLLGDEEDIRTTVMNPTVDFRWPSSSLGNIKDRVNKDLLMSKNAQRKAESPIVYGDEICSFSNRFGGSSGLMKTRREIEKTQMTSEEPALERLQNESAWVDRLDPSGSLVILAVALLVNLPSSSATPVDVHATMPPKKSAAAIPECSLSDREVLVVVAALRVPKCKPTRVDHGPVPQPSQFNKNLERKDAQLPFFMSLGRLGRGLSERILKDIIRVSNGQNVKTTGRSCTPTR